MSETHDPPAAFRPRWNISVAGIGWLIWLAAALWLSWDPLLWHVDYFKKPGLEYYRLLLALLPAIAAATFLYHYVRKRGLWRFELRGLAAFALSAALWYEPTAVLIALWLFAACYLTGSFVLDKLGLDVESHAESVALSAGAGLSALIACLFVLGLARLYYLWIFIGLLGAPLLLFFPRIRRLLSDLRGLDSSWRETPAFARPWFTPLVVFTAIFLLFTLMVAVSPCIAYDAMRHHIPAFRYYEANHLLEPLQVDEYSYYPQNFEILMTNVYALGGLPATQFINPMVFLLGLLMAYRLARLCGIERASALAGVVFGGTIPFLHWTGSILKNDFLVAFCQLAALACYLRARKSENGNWLLLGTLLIAVSAGVKHVAVFGAIPLGILYAIRIRRHRRPWKLLGTCMVVFALAGLVWPLRNYVLVGNPYYPDNVMASIDPGSAELVKGIPPPHWQLPWAVHFDGYWAFEAPTNHPMGMFLVLFGPVWLFWGRRRPSKAERACLFYVLAFFLYWGYIWPIVRYAISAILGIAILTAARLSAFHEESRPAIRWAIRGAVVYSFLFAMLVAMTIEVNVPQLRYLAGRIDREAYLREAVEGFETIEYLNEHAGPGDRIYSLHNCVHGYLRKVGSFRCDRPRPENGPARLEEAFQEGVWDLLVAPNEQEWDRIVEQFFQRRRLRAEARHRDEDYVVYALEERAEQASSNP